MSVIPTAIHQKVPVLVHYINHQVSTTHPFISEGRKFPARLSTGVVAICKDMSPTTLYEVEEKGVEEKKVVLHGMWASPFVTWVKIALKIKGISYEYVEESMKKKSESLLKHNPIHQKVPVLVHKGKPIVESLIILQYIDDTWTTSPYLLPSDAYSKSMVRFWADFILNQLNMPLRKLVASQGLEEEKLMLEVQTNLNILEQNIDVIFPGDSPPSCVEDMGMLDILLSCLPYVIKAIEEALNVKIMEPQNYPLTTSRMATLSGLQVVKDTAPSHEKMVKFFRAYRRFYTHNNNYNNNQHFCTQ